MRGRAASSVASARWQRKSEDWQAIASLATTTPLHRGANSYRRLRETRDALPSATKENETEMSHAFGVQANSTSEWGGGAVSFATKEEAIAPPRGPTGAPSQIRTAGDRLLRP